MRIYGQYVTKKEVEEIKVLIKGTPQIKRSELSREVCKRFGWRSKNGKLKEMSCRKVLLNLDRRGIIELPEAKEVKNFKKGLKNLGFDIGISQTPITPIIIGSSEKAQTLSRLLYEKEGIFVQAFSYPVVLKGADRIRTIVNANHTREELDYVLGSLENLGKDLEII